MMYLKQTLMSKKNYRNPFYFIAILLFCSSNLLAQTDNIIVLPQNIAVPAEATKLGSIKAGNNTSAIHCDYDAVINEAKSKARAMGGNVVKITELISPVFIGKCYSINADVFLAKDISAYHPAQPDSMSDLSAVTDYAILYVYRMPDTIALATSYNLHLNNDSVLCKVKSRSIDVVKIYKEGPATLWAKTEKRADVTLNVKFGEEYYVMCGLVKGELRMIPELQIRNKEAGIADLQKLNKKKRKKDMNVKYLQQIH